MRNEPTLFWKDIISQMDAQWQKKKHRKYPFLGQDFKTLKTLLRLFSPQEVLGMWEIYLQGTTFWGPKTGYLISGMLQDRSHLIDHPDLKKLTAKYEAQLGMREVKEVAHELGL